MFAGLYPVEANEYEALREALEKLHLNDASFHYEPETSQALGFGFRCGFLGLLHMDIVQERLEREYGMHLITTAPSVVYEVKLRDGTRRAALQPVAPAAGPETIEEFREPIMACKIFVPQEYVGPVITLCTEKRGTQTNMHYSARHVVISYDLPLNEVVLDFFDRLKSMTRGYGSLDYEFKEYRAADMVRLDILVNGDKVDALSSMVHRSGAQHRGRELVDQAAEPDPAADVRRRGAGGDRRPHHRARERQGAAQERARQVLRRRRHAQAQAAREAEGRQEAHEAGRRGGDSPGGVPRGAAAGRELNFALFLLILLVVTGGGVGARSGVSAQRRRRQDAKQPWWVEYSVSFFPVILIVFLLRSFLVEPFKIPSSSMVPTLLVGDFILVNKYTYGIRLPVANRKLVELGEPAARRRDGVPLSRRTRRSTTSSAWSALPGDRIEYRNKRLSINGTPVPLRQVDDYLSKERMQFSRRYVETRERRRA